MRRLFVVLTGTLGLMFIAPAAFADTYSAPLTSAISAIPTATENRTGYSRDLFPHWTDDDGDGCNTRNEVLLSEAETRPSVGSGCTLSGGRWFSYYDGVSQYSAGALDVDHMVPLAEAWDSGARTWTTTTRRAYANDLGDYRPLVGVTAAVNRAKGDQDIREWKPAREQCRYLKEWVAVKIRWRLTADSSEKSAMSGLAGGCTNTTITVVRAR